MLETKAPGISQNGMNPISFRDRTAGFFFRFETIATVRMFFVLDTFLSIEELLLSFLQWCMVPTRVRSTVLTIQDYRIRLAEDNRKTKGLGSRPASQNSIMKQAVDRSLDDQHFVSFLFMLFLFCAAKKRSLCNRNKKGAKQEISLKHR